MIYTHKVSFPVKVALNGLVTIAILAEFILFDLLAIDRLLAVTKPMTSKWKRSAVLKIYLCIIFVLIVPVEVIFRSVTITKAVPFKVAQLLSVILSYYYITMQAILVITNLLSYTVLVGTFGWTLLKSNRDSVQRMKAIMKVAVTSFEASVLFTITLIPQLYYLSNPRKRDATLSNLCSINYVTNAIIFIMNNRFLRRKLTGREGSIQDSSTTTS